MDVKPNNSPRIAFLVLLIALMFAFGAIIRPFIVPIVFAMLIAVICGPIYSFILRCAFNRRYVASFFATLFVLVCILIPLTIVVGIVIIYSGDAINYAVQNIESGNVSVQLDQLTTFINQKAAEYSNFIPANFDFKTTLLSFFSSAGKVVYNYSPKVLSATAGIFGGFLLTVVFVFVFFADGGKLYHALFDLLPLEEDHKNIITNEINGVISAVFLGQIVTSLAQGILIGIAFWIVGIEDPLIWGAVGVAVTLIPVIGGPLMYVPTSILFFLNGAYGRGVFLLAFGIGVISMVDNFIKPLVLRGKVNVNPVLLALSLIGGGLWLGASGIIFGPLIVVLLLTFLKIYSNSTTSIP